MKNNKELNKIINDYKKVLKNPLTKNERHSIEEIIVDLEKEKQFINKNIKIN